ncbi:hypothetical protein AGABI1DRAFT_116827 [Agaricus bisporus var. burnettii JB137-S8]|uniref:Aminoglycoside phosphotransferase domain-containing protein n=1 Tax=Agaricus bisporus var. burnettii (strain JB137-S8 / ATCC MYA-4627 / FGSC 10392) TaxID=597362 RepID=K5VJF5_AGABU|nr:uncharacterized protein AGABI1DRAFT_116827 [Agaricus bisporus var. burnettii JB137-S8]EKM74489.1 hypothetical protein AGABI1DRAFT_116827 [Agaricus bisporus var. burnettii JB137-S8]
MYPEYETLKYISRCAKNDINAPRVPEIIHFFHRRDRCLAYLVMENINLTPPPEDFHERVAKAIQWLRKCPVSPDGATLGPLGGGAAHHELFGESKAPLKFSSTLALERFLNTAITMLPPKGRSSTAPIRISHERLVFTQSDMDESNFGVDDQGRTCLFDFTTVGLLPESFASYTMALRMPFTEAVARCLDWSPTPNLQSMSRIARVLAMSSGTLGLDEDGNPINPISFQRRFKRIRKNGEAGGEANLQRLPYASEP